MDITNYYDNVVIHSSPNSKCIVKAGANFRMGNKIKLRIVMRDLDAVMAYMESRKYLDVLPYKIIVHR